MKNWLCCLAVLAGLVGASARADDAQDEFRDVKVEAIPVAAGIWMLTGRGGNIGVSAGDDGVFLIDDQYAPLTERIRAAIAKLSDRPVRFVLNTHWHGDHTGGNENLGRAGVVIVAHDQVYERMTKENFLAAFNQKVPPAPRAALPVISFNDSVTFHLNGHDIHAVHVPNAHTDGDSVVHFRDANVIHTGDIYFNGMYPFIDADSGGSLDGVIAGVDVILALADGDTRIIPGHGPLSDRDGLAAYRRFLVDVRDRIGALVAQGRTVEEIRAARPLAGYEDTLGGGYFNTDTFIGIAVAAMKKPAH